MSEVQYTPQRSGGWGGWPWIAGLATAAATAVAVAIGLSIVQPDVGASPSPSPSATSTASPAPTASGEATPTPAATATPATSAAPSPGASGEIGPVWSMAPEEAFSPPDSCENPEAGYRIWMPDEWYYNTAFEPFPECSLFAPVTFTATDDGSVPDGVAIDAQLTGPTGGLGFFDEIVSRDTYTVAGLEALRYVLEPAPGGQLQESTVQWAIRVSGNTDDNTAVFVIFKTDAGRAADEPSFQANVDVLDRMVATFELLEP